MKDNIAVTAWVYSISALVCGCILGITSVRILATNNRIEVLEDNQGVISNSIVSLSDEHSQDVSDIQNEIQALKEVNAEQEKIIASQQEVIDTYDQKFEDLHKEVDAYTEVLEKEAPKFQLPTTWTGAKTTKQNGGVMGPSGRETYYNLNMKNCVANMRKRGYDEKRYPVWERDDGAKMFGHYVMIAANWKIRPLGTIVETSIGWGIVVDTGEFVKDYPRGIDLAVNW